LAYLKRLHAFGVSFLVRLADPRKRASIFAFRLLASMN
jgi:hypothetical protein